MSGIYRSLPYAGASRIRFNGYDLRPYAPTELVATPRLGENIRRYGTKVKDGGLGE